MVNQKYPQKYIKSKVKSKRKGGEQRIDNKLNKTETHLSGSSQEGNHLVLSDFGRGKLVFLRKGLRDEIADLHDGLQIQIRLT